MTIPQPVTLGPCTMYHGDCLEILPHLSGVDAVITDPPYESQAHKPICRTRAAVEGRVPVTGVGFEAITSELRTGVSMASVKICSGWVMFFCQIEAIAYWVDALEAAGARYDRSWIWVKPDAAPRFNGQGPAQGFESIATAFCGSGVKRWNGGGSRNVLTFNATSGRATDHPTEKPVPLMSKLITLYTNVGDTIGDWFMGSGTTGIACIRTGRKFIGIEKDPKHFKTSCERIERELQQQRLAL